MGGKSKSPVAHETFEPIYQAIREIPQGRIATYSDVGLVCGYPRGGRVVARALRVSTKEHLLPWYRVMGKSSGSWAHIAIRSPGLASIQRQMLESEGVVFSRNGKVSLKQFGLLQLL